MGSLFSGGADGTRKRRLSEIAGENEQVARQPDSEIRASSDDNPATSGAVIDCDRLLESPRTDLVAALTRAVDAAARAGDLEAARVAHKALGELLGGPGGNAAPVADLGLERAKRGAK